MILQNQEEKNAFLSECSQHIRRIQNSSGVKEITDAKIHVLETIFNTVIVKDISGNGINLDNVYKEVKKQLHQGKLSRLPVSDLMLKTLGSFDRTSNVNAIMKSHREVPLDNAFGYFLNLLRKESLSTTFLKRTGFFNVNEQNLAVNNPDLDGPQQVF